MASGLSRWIFIVIIFAIGLASADPSCHSHRRNNRSNKPNLSTPEECARPCIQGAKPKTCYYHFTVEYYSTLSKACDLCRLNSTTRLTNECQCIEADGYEKTGIITVNRMYPGPSIMVCLGDYVVIDVANHATGNGITIHWHGVFQKGYQYYDGVPFVTQCPIEEGATFRYQWKAQNSGSHFWHAHTGLHKIDGLEGALIVREPITTEPNSDQWDFDNIDNVMFLTDWLHDSAGDHYPGTWVNRPGQLPDNFLINGKGQWTDPVTGNRTKTSLAVMSVKKGHRYRIRMINSCGMTCPILLSIEGHNMTVIATDGENIKPVVVNSIVSFSAERYDFVINANKPVGDYWIQARGIGECTERKTQQLAILRYESTSKKAPASKEPTYEVGIGAGLVLNQLNVECNGNNTPANALCVSNLQSAKPVNTKLLRKDPDIKLFMPINFHPFQTVDLFKPGTYRRFLVAGGRQTAGLVANISNILPPSPLISQRSDIPEENICSTQKLPPRCAADGSCTCSHVDELPLGALVEIILVDEAQILDLSHPFHLHGHAFSVIGHGCGSEYNVSSISVNIAKDLDKKGIMYRHLQRPASKDTFAVPNNGFTIIRFIADNPGYWLFHCHFQFHLAAGMTSVFHVGQPSDLKPVPKGFPKCGNFLPPIDVLS